MPVNGYGGRGVGISPAVCHIIESGIYLLGVVEGYKFQAGLLEVRKALEVA